MTGTWRLVNCYDVMNLHGFVTQHVVTQVVEAGKRPECRSYYYWPDK